MSVPPPPPARAVSRLLAALTSRAGEEALLFRGRSWTFADLDRLSRAYARGLASLGIRRGDRVAVFAESAPEVVAALIGHYRLGAIHVPVNPRYRAEETRHILSDSGARAVVHDRSDASAESGTARVLEAIGPVPGLDFRIALGSGASPVPGPAGSTTWEALAGAHAAQVAGELPEPEADASSDADVATIVYTSGTTGVGKGVALSFGALFSNVDALTSSWKFSSRDRLSLALPLFHVHGLAIGVHGALLHGMALLLSSRFDAREIVRDFEERGATVFLGVPTMYVRLLEEMRARPDAAKSLARGRLFTSGSAPLPAGDLTAFERATGHRILERYGMTETLFTLSNPYDGERRAGTVGLPVPGCEVTISADVEGAAPGELLVRGNGMMNGYWGRREETAASFRGAWFATGDIAQRDEAGYVRILGRASVDFIKSGGFKIAAREIEEVIASHPAVREAAVVGAPDRVWGERVVAAIVLREQPAEGATDIAEDVAEEVLALCREALADYKRPREVRVLFALPRNALGKIQKHRILERMKEEEEGEG